MIRSLVYKPGNASIANSALKHLTFENVKQDVLQLLVPDAPVTRIVEGVVSAIAD